MIVLQEDRGDWSTQHFAFMIEDADLEDAAARLREQGIDVDGPHIHDWVPARSVYFSDLDGHSVELLSLLKRGC